MSERRGSAIVPSAAAFAPSCSISFSSLCDAGRAQRGRKPAELRDGFQLHAARDSAPCELAGGFGGGVVGLLGVAKMIR